jgi:hypothetical protein
MKTMLNTAEDFAVRQSFAAFRLLTARSIVMQFGRITAACFSSASEVRPSLTEVNRG